MPTLICSSLWTQRIKHTKGHLSLSCSGLVKFSGFPFAKTSANKRLLLCLLPFAADVQTSPAQVHDAKVLQNLRMCKFLVEKVLGVLKVLRGNGAMLFSVLG